jgi:hypothetical protein
VLAVPRLLVAKSEAEQKFSPTLAPRMATR